METTIDLIVVVSVVGGVATAYITGYFLQATAIPIQRPGPPMDNAPEDCKAACRQWQLAQLARVTAERAVQTAKLLADAAKVSADKAFWLQISALALWLGFALNPVLREYAIYLNILYLAAVAHYIVCLGKLDAALKDLEKNALELQADYNAENNARMLVITTCTGEQADDCLSHPQPG